MPENLKQKNKGTMKKKSLIILLTFFCFVFLHAQTPGELNISVNTKAAGGNYAPRNVVAIWISNANGDFVKTLLAYANKRKTHLNNWENSTTKAGSSFNTVDAITGATQYGHATRTCKWDGKNYLNSSVLDGTYYVNMEFTFFIFQTTKTQLQKRLLKNKNIEFYVRKKSV